MGAEGPGKPWRLPNPPEGYRIHISRGIGDILWISYVSRRLFLRLVRLKPLVPYEGGDPPNMATEDAGTPTFNIQEEMIFFHVSSLLDGVNQNLALLCLSTPKRKHHRGAQYSPYGQLVFRTT